MLAARYILVSNPRWSGFKTGQVEKAEVLKPKYGNGSTETKYGSEKKSHLSV